VLSGRLGGHHSRHNTRWLLRVAPLLQHATPRHAGWILVVQRAAETTSTTIEHVRVDHCRTDARVVLTGGRYEAQSAYGQQIIKILEQAQIATLYIDPGCPWQNGKEERFNGTVRDECLNMQLFASVAEAHVHLQVFRRHYNEERPHSALGYRTPAEFKRAWVAAQEKPDDPNIAT
jgi:transposase InsO family protein